MQRFKVLKRHKCKHGISWKSFCSYRTEIEYNKIRQFPEFCSRISKKSFEFFLVAARERRGFNLLYRFWTGAENLVTTSGLLVRYQDLASEYFYTGHFPPILIVDDMAIYGRGISKILWQLKFLVFKTLNNTHPGFVTRAQFDQSFKKNVEVQVYAASHKADIILREPLSVDTFTGELSSICEIHDLSLQFSQVLLNSDVANTSFSFSARCKSLSNFMVSSDIDLPLDWIRIRWLYEGEESFLFLKPWGSDVINGISTLRIFPARGNLALPQITCFPILGEFSENTMCHIFSTGALLARRFDYVCMEKIFSESAQELWSEKAQLVSFIVSILDFLGFCALVHSPSGCQFKIGDISCDIKKISCNFGGGDELLHEFTQFISDGKAQKAFRRALFPIVSNEIKPLLNISPTSLLKIDMTSLSSEFINQCNNEIAEYIYQIGFRDEVRASIMAARPYLFVPLRYQEDRAANSKYGRDGVISLEETIKMLIEDLSLEEETKHLCGRLVAFIVAMDHGLVGMKESVRDSANSGLSVHLLTKAGELSTFYYPKMLSTFIPAFSMVENLFYLRAKSKQEAVTIFLRESNACMNVLSAEEINKFQIYIAHIYKCGQTFSEWNFSNLTRVPGEAALRIRLLSSAKKFLHID